MKYFHKGEVYLVVEHNKFFKAGDVFIILNEDNYKGYVRYIFYHLNDKRIDYAHESCFYGLKQL